MIAWQKHLAACCLCLAFGQQIPAQTTNISISVADTFVCTGSPNYQNGADLTVLNFGAAGTLVVAPAGGPKGEFQSVLAFNLAPGLNLFNAAYGSNNWAVSEITLELTSNYGAAGEQPNNPLFPVITTGQFIIEWLGANDWAEGTGMPNLPTTDGVTYNSLPGLMAGARESLSTNVYAPPGDNVPVIYPLPLSLNLLAEIYSGTNVTFHLWAADDHVGCLFNSYKFGHGNEPKLQIIASPLLKIISAIETHGIFSLRGIGNNNSPYTIQASTNLTAGWMTVGTVTSDNSGVIQFDAPACSAQAQRFYRLSQ